MVETGFIIELSYPADSYFCKVQALVLLGLELCSEC